MSLLTHVKFVHGQQNQQVCHICARVYNSPASLRQHLKEHSGIEEPRITCDKCGRSSKNEIALRKHMTIHEDEGKSFPCPDCQKIYSNRMALAAHVRGTHNFKLHKCHLCDKEFKRAITLKVCMNDMSLELAELIVSTSIFRNTLQRTPAHSYTTAIIVRKNSNVPAIYIPTTKSSIRLNGVSIDINQHGNKSNNVIYKSIHMSVCEKRLPGSIGALWQRKLVPGITTTTTHEGINIQRRWNYSVWTD